MTPDAWHMTWACTLFLLSFKYNFRLMFGWKYPLVFNVNFPSLLCTCFNLTLKLCFMHYFENKYYFTICCCLFIELVAIELELSCSCPAPLLLFYTFSQGWVTLHILADPGKARGCSRNTIVINWVGQWPFSSADFTEPWCLQGQSYGFQS